MREAAREKADRQGASPTTACARGLAVRERQNTEASAGKTKSSGQILLRSPRLHPSIADVILNQNHVAGPGAGGSGPDFVHEAFSFTEDCETMRNPFCIMADVDFVSENFARRMSRQCWQTIHHKTVVYTAPGSGARPASVALTA